MLKFSGIVSLIWNKLSEPFTRKEKAMNVYKVDIYNRTPDNVYKKKIIADKYTLNGF